MHLFIASAAVTTAILSGLYAVAATAATSLAGAINTEETARHTRSVEFSARVSQAPATYPGGERKPAKPTTTRQKTP